MNHKKTLKMKRIVSGMLALTLLFGGAVLPNDVMSNVASVITAQAATIEGDFYSFDEATGVLTLKGTVNGVEMIKFTQDFKSKVKSVIAEKGTIFPKSSCAGFFANFDNCTSIDLSEADTIKVKETRSMFSGCSKLTSLDISSLDTSNVMYWGDMFSNCTSLRELDVSGFDTSSAIIMSDMFFNCSNLATLDVSGFDTSNVTNMNGMFAYCSELTELDVSGFDTRNVTWMSCVFLGCSKLTKLDVSNFNTSNVTALSSMFTDCSNLSSLDLSNFDTSKVTIMAKMFSDCSNLSSLDLGNFDTSNVTNMVGMFSGCSGLTSLDVSNFDTRKVTDMHEMFYRCSKLTSLDLSKFDTSKVTDMKSMFRGCSKLSKLDVSSFDTSNVKDMTSMFDYCSQLTSLNLSKFDTRKVTNMFGMFYNCKALKELNLSSFDTINVKQFNVMFKNCSELTSLDLRNFDTRNATSMIDMFKDCNKLKKLTLGILFSKITEGAALRNGYGWIKRFPKLKHVSGNGEYAVIDNDGYNTYYLFEAYQPTYPTKIKYEYNEQYHQGKFTWNKVLLAERYGVLVYLAGKWRVQTQDIPATTTSYITPKDSIFSSSTYKVAIAAKVNGKWDTENAIKNAVATIVDGSVDPRKYCSGNRSDATKHLLEFDGNTYKCTKCDFIAHEPCFEDHKILNKDDYNTLIALDYILYNISSEEPPYSEGESNHDERILQLIGEIDKIRRKDEYKNKYSFSDSEGRCISKVLESDAYKSLSAGFKCEVDLVTINSSNYTEYNYWYGNTSTYIIYALSALSITNPYLCATLFWLNDITAPETFGKDNREMLNLCMSSFAKNFAYTIGSDYVFETNKSKITGDKKWERDFNYTMTCFCIDYNEDVLDKDKDKYDLQTGDTFVHASWGHYCEKCLEDPNHEDSLTYSEKRDHFKYTRYRRDTVWMRDGEILFYKTTD